jgi:uncharacterized protein (TIGR03083 family)
MSIDTVRPVEEIRPIARSTDAREVALAAYDRLITLLEALEPEDWAAPTECPGWDVAAMVGHLVGAAKSGASVREAMRQQGWAKKHAGEFEDNALDAANELQIRDHAELSPSERIAMLREVAPRAVRGRMRFPRPLRRASVSLDAGGSAAAGMPSRLSFGHLMDVIYTRDVWLHTIDIARATGRAYVPDAAVDARIVEDVVAEWARRHGEPFVLVLSGPAGARFRAHEGGGHLHLDAVECCRILSGRTDAADAVSAGMLEADPPETARLLDTRVLF